MCICETVQDAGENVGELWELAAALGKTEGVAWFYKQLKKFKVGTNNIETEAAKLWRESRQRGVREGGEDSGEMPRNVKIVAKKIDMVKEEVGMVVKEQRKHFEELFRLIMNEEGIDRGSRKAKKLKLRLEGERVKAFEEDKVIKEEKLEHLREDKKC